jgi:hypothetical protein
MRAAAAAAEPSSSAEAAGVLPGDLEPGRAPGVPTGSSGYRSRWVAANNGARRNVRVDHAVVIDDCARADRYARQHHDMPAEEGAGTYPNRNGTRGDSGTHSRFVGMRGVADLYEVADQGVLLDHYFPDNRELTVSSDPHAVADDEPRRDVCERLLD